MTIIPEKDDVDISRLFNWGGKFDILDSQGEVVFSYYARIIGEADLNRARVFALRKSAEMRLRVNDPESDEGIAYKLDKSTITKESLIEATLVLMGSEFGRKALKTVNVSFPKEPDSDSTLEEQEKYQKAKDDFPMKVKEATTREVEKLVNAERERLNKFDFDVIYNHYTSGVINELCEKEMISQFNDSCVYYGSFNDSNYTDKTFKSVEEFQKLPKPIKDQFIYNYSTLELTMDDLKKSGGATQ